MFLWVMGITGMLCLVVQVCLHRVIMSDGTQKYGEL